MKSAAAIMLVATSWGFAAPAAAAPSVRTLAAEEARLAEMAYRMATANAGLCDRTQMMTGLIVHDLTQYQPARRAEVSRAFSLREGFGVLQMVSGGAASRSGLRIDDEIIAVGGVAVNRHPADLKRPASFRRAQSFSDILDTQLAKGPTEFLIRRDGQSQRVTLTGERGCGGELSLSSSGTLNAWADGRHIIVTTGMRDFARSDDEVAFVIAHEMAHNILGHLGPHSKMGIFGTRARNSELDADRFAVRLMSAGGYQPSAGVAFLERSRRRLWWAFSLDHPSFGGRIRAITAEISRWRGDSYRYRHVSAPTSTPPAEIVASLVQASLSPAQPSLSDAQAGSFVPLR
jgi:hypothetical protein